MYISFLKLKPYDQWKFYLKQNKISGIFFQRGILDLVFLNVNHMKVSFPIKKKISQKFLAKMQTFRFGFSTSKTIWKFLFWQNRNFLEISWKDAHIFTFGFFKSKTIWKFLFRQKKNLTEISCWYLKYINVVI